MRREGRVRVFGARTAGAMLSARRFDLGGGWIVAVPCFDYVTSDGARLEGKGVAPDVACPAREAEAKAREWLAGGAPN